MTRTHKPHWTGDEQEQVHMGLGGLGQMLRKIGITWSSLCRPDWHLTHRSACLCPSAGIKDVHNMPCSHQFFILLMYLVYWVRVSVCNICWPETGINQVGLEFIEDHLPLLPWVLRFKGHVWMLRESILTSVIPLPQPPEYHHSQLI